MVLDALPWILVSVLSAVLSIAIIGFMLYRKKGRLEPAAKLSITAAAVVIIVVVILILILELVVYPSAGGPDDDGVFFPFWIIWVAAIIPIIAARKNERKLSKKEIQSRQRIVLAGAIALILIMVAGLLVFLL